MPERIVRIGFRGLMVLNYQGSVGNRFMEIGFLDARTASTPGGSHVHTPASSAVHIPRVLTTENGVLSELLDLRHPNLGGVLGTVRRWSLNVVSNVQQTPRQTEVTLKGGSAPPPHLPPPNDQRRAPETDANKQDFGWIIDLENREMHEGNLTNEISTAKLLMVLKVERGEFFTQLLSPVLDRNELGHGSTSGFGRVAAVTGLDITFDVPADINEAEVQLMAGNRVIKTFKTKTVDVGSTKVNTRVFEISNAPADVFAEGAIPANAPGHFHMYYDKLFLKSPPDRQFDFKAINPAPGPDPALCGIVSLGERSDGL